MANQTANLKVGDDAPDFELKATNGETFKLSDFRGKKNVAVHFFPAAFTGVCSTQLPMVQQEKANFEAADTQIVAISIDHTASQSEFAKKLGIDYPLAADFHPKGAVAQKYGVYLEDRGLTSRALIVVDKGGKIRHIDVTPELAQIPDEGAALACARSL